MIQLYLFPWKIHYLFVYFPHHCFLFKSSDNPLNIIMSITIRKSGWWGKGYGRQFPEWSSRRSCKYQAWSAYRQCKKESWTPQALAVGDYSNGKEQRPLSERDKIDINKNNFNSVMAEFSPAVNLTVEDTLSGNGNEQNIALEFKSLKDLNPNR